MSAREYLNETGLASLWAKIVNKINAMGDLCVKKAGDAVNGVLYWPTDINTNGTYQIPKGEDAIRLDDIFNRRVSVFGAQQVINTKRVETYIETHNYDGGTTKSAKLAMSIDESGNENITVSSPSAWRTALGLATVASSGDYTDLTNKPTIPAAQVNADWSASSGVAQILNKPTIPSVYNGMLTIQKNGSTVQLFSANSSLNATANIIVPKVVGGTLIITFNGSGYRDVARTSFTGINSKPDCLIVFGQSVGSGIFGYDWDNSSNTTLRVYGYKINSNNQLQTLNGNVRVAWIAIDK